MTDDLADAPPGLRAALGPVAAVEACPDGIENRTAIVTLADSRRVVVQRIRSRVAAPHKVALATILPRRLADVGVPSPALVAADPADDPPWLVRTHAAGRSGSALLRAPGLDHGAAVRLGAGVGRWWRRLPAVDIDGVRLYRAWADPARLAGLATRWVERCADLVGEAGADVLADDVLAVRDGPAARPGLCHGDLGPGNIIAAADGTPVALLDLEFARLADPLVDAAWWRWTVRHLHPAAWPAAWDGFRSVADLDIDADARLASLERLRLLEIVDHTRRRGDAVAGRWAQALRATLAERS